MNILITGASGNVGSFLIKALAAGNRVVSVGRTPAPKAHTSYAIDFVEQQAELAHVFKTEKPQAVIHLAAVLGGACESDPALAKKVNVDATRDLAELSVKHGAKQFIFFSTSAVYDQHKLEPTNETSNISPHNVYGQTKLNAEAELAKTANKTKTTQFISLRPFNIYGPRFERSLVYMLIHSTPEKPINLFAFKTLYRDYVHVLDVAKATAQVLAHTFTDPHTVINIGSGVATNTEQLVKAIAAAGVTPHYTVGPTDSGDITWADITKAKRLLGFNPKTQIVVDR